MWSKNKMLRIKANWCVVNNEDEQYVVKEPKEFSIMIEQHEGMGDSIDLYLEYYFNRVKEEIKKYVGED